MTKPIEKSNGLWICPVCGDELVITTIRYNKIVNGIFKSDKVIKETTYHSNKCGWEYIEKVEE